MKKNRFILPLFLLVAACAHLNAKLAYDKSGITEINIQEVIAPRTTDELKAIILRAKEINIPITLQGSQHSQGGHSLAQDGFVIDLSSWKGVQADRHNPGRARVQAGATWKKVLQTLYKHNYQSVSIMQSDYDFTVGGSLATNVHGWRMHKPPFIDSVIGFNIMTADGQIRYCSRTENTDLFNAAIGGYGLLGIVLDVDLETATTRFYAGTKKNMETEEFIPYFSNHIQSDPAQEFFFGRFRLDKYSFLKKMTVRTAKPSTQQQQDEFKGGVGRAHEYFPVLSKIARTAFDLTRDSNIFKAARWHAEGQPVVDLFKGDVERTNLQYVSTDFYATQDPKMTDLLQEYFIPVDRFNEFVAYLQVLEIPLSEYLMNITVRSIKKDTESILSYANDDMLCFVMFFRGKKYSDFDEKLGELSRIMIGKAHMLGGSYYLPYRPYATQAQFERSYPRAIEFLTIKEKYDPTSLFTNAFYDTYLKPLADQVPTPLVEPVADEPTVEEIMAAAVPVEPATTEEPVVVAAPEHTPEERLTQLLTEMTAQPVTQDTGILNVLRAATQKMEAVHTPVLEASIEEVATTKEAVTNQAEEIVMDEDTLAREDLAQLAVDEEKQQVPTAQEEVEEVANLFNDGPAEVSAETIAEPAPAEQVATEATAEEPTSIKLPTRTVEPEVAPAE